MERLYLKLWKRYLMEANFFDSDVDFTYPINVGDKYRLIMTDDRYVDFEITYVRVARCTKNRDKKCGNVDGKVIDFEGIIACEPGKNKCGKAPVKIGDRLVISRYDDGNFNDSYNVKMHGDGSTWYVSLFQTFGGGASTPQDIMVGLEKIS